MRIEVKKIYKGMVSVRDYLVKKAIKNEEDLTIYNDSGEMTIPHSQLGQSGTIQTRNLPSKFKGHYSLVDFRWKPKDKLQQELF